MLRRCLLIGIVFIALGAAKASAQFPGMMPGMGMPGMGMPGMGMPGMPGQPFQAMPGMPGSMTTTTVGGGNFGLKLGPFNFSSFSNSNTVTMIPIPVPGMGGMGMGGMPG